MQTRYLGITYALGHSNIFIGKIKHDVALWLFTITMENEFMMIFDVLP